MDCIEIIPRLASDGFPSLVGQDTIPILRPRLCVVQFKKGGCSHGFRCQRNRYSSWLGLSVNAIYSQADLAKRQGVGAKTVVMAAPPGPEQKRILALLADHPDALERSCRPGHLTGSALVINPVDHRILVLYHSKLQRWLQPGGHADGDPDLARVALREAVEETGIDDLQLVEPAIDLDVHRVDPPGESPHEHHDIRFLVVSPSGAEPVGNHESKELRWIYSSELTSVGADSGLCRLADRGLALVSRLQNDGVI